MALSEGLDLRLNQAVRNINYSGENGIQVEVYNPRNSSQTTILTGENLKKVKFYSYLCN